jgi:hypothetical protein
MTNLSKHVDTRLSIVSPLMTQLLDVARTVALAPSRHYATDGAMWMLFLPLRAYAP